MLSTACRAAAINPFRLLKVQPLCLASSQESTLDINNTALQVPLLPVYLKTVCQPASFLSQYLPAVADSYIPARFTNQVNCFSVLLKLTRSSEHAVLVDCCKASHIFS